MRERKDWRKATVIIVCSSLFECIVDVIDDVCLDGVLVMVICLNVEVLVESIC